MLSASIFPAIAAVCCKNELACVMLIPVSYMNLARYRTPGENGLYRSVMGLSPDGSALIYALMAEDGRQTRTARPIKLNSIIIRV